MPSSCSSVTRIPLVNCLYQYRRYIDPAYLGELVLPGSSTICSDFLLHPSGRSKEEKQCGLVYSYILFNDSATLETFGTKSQNKLQMVWKDLSTIYVVGPSTQESLLSSPLIVSVVLVGLHDRGCRTSRRKRSTSLTRR